MTTDRAATERARELAVHLRLEWGEESAMMLRRAEDAERENGRLRELAKRARTVAAMPDYDEAAIHDALWALADAALAVPSEQPDEANAIHVQAGTADAQTPHNEQPDEETTFAWLLERGQSQNHSPTVWWTGDETVGWTGWTTDAWKAKRYGTKAEAEAEIRERFTFRASVPPTADAVQHGFAVSSSGERNAAT